MTRIARIVVPHAPHHVTQRGNRRERVFLEARDYELYRDWLAESCRKFGVSVWAYCLMPNHVHLVLAPSDPAGLALASSARSTVSTLDISMRGLGRPDTCSKVASGRWRWMKII
jgi:putative transposase